MVVLFAAVDGAADRGSRHGSDWGDRDTLRRHYAFVAGVTALESAPLPAW